MAIELRQCEAVDVPALLQQLGGWHREARLPFLESAATRALLELTRDPALGRFWAISHRGRLIGYAVVQHLAARGFLWREADLVALFLEPAARGNGVGRSVRRILRELLLGQGFAMIPTAVLEDRSWTALGTRADGSTLFEAA